MWARKEAEKSVKETITITQTRDYGGLDQGLIRESNEKLSDYENILKLRSIGFPIKLNVQGKGKRIVIDDYLKFLA